jgi:Tfp pilus assembly protein PilZ
MKLSTIIPAAMLLLTFIACNKSKNHDLTLTAIDYKQEENYTADTTAKDKQAPGEKPGVPDPDWDKKIIKIATLNIEVKDYSKFYSDLYASVKRVGGYVVQENQSQSEYKIENEVTIKVPVLQFDEAIRLITNGNGQEKLIEKKIRSEDVTGQVVDTKSRLEAKRQVRLRYLELLKQAKNMAEVLQVQNEINDLHEQIEMAAGRISYLNQSAAYSTIQLTFFQVLNPSASTDTEPSFLVKLGNAFENGWDFIKLVLLGIISIWPLLVLTAGLWFGFKRWKLSKAS